jgi:chromosome segregation ATPase
LFDRTSFDPELSKLRSQLEDESNACVKHRAKIEESENLCQHLGQRIKFFQSDAQAHKQKISALENQLADINSQRDYLIRSAQLAEESISRDQQRITTAEKDLENLISKLKTDRSRNKQIEFEMQTLNDELAFLKAVFQEEVFNINYLTYDR